MKWVKASEGLPKNLKGAHYRNAKTKSPIPYISIERRDTFGNYFIRFWNTEADISHISIDEIEWLDESQPPSGDKIREALELALPYLEDLQTENHNEPNAGIFYDYKLEEAITKAKQALKED